MLDPTMHADQAERHLDESAALLDSMVGTRPELMQDMSIRIKVLLQKAQVHATLATVTG